MWSMARWDVGTVLKLHGAGTMVDWSCDDMMVAFPEKEFNVNTD